MDEKTKKLLVTLEVLALVVSLLLILIDYKLKGDLLSLFKRIERDLYGREDSSPPEPPKPAGNAGVRSSDLLDNPAGVEETSSSPLASPNGREEPASSNGSRTATKRSPRARGPAIPDNGKPVGP